MGLIAGDMSTEKQAKVDKWIAKNARGVKNTAYYKEALKRNTFVSPSLKSRNKNSKTSLLLLASFSFVR